MKEEHKEPVLKEEDVQRQVTLTVTQPKPLTFCEKTAVFFTTCFAGFCKSFSVSLRQACVQSQFI
jgi:hypothetical protein